MPVPVGLRNFRRVVLPLLVLHYLPMRISAPRYAAAPFTAGSIFWFWVAQE